MIDDTVIRSDLRYLKLLAQRYPTIAEASTEIINLQAILNLPKPTEHFISDPHGESEAFNHVLRNASGYIRRKVDEIWGNALPTPIKKELCTLIYYPEEKLRLLRAAEQNNYDYYSQTLHMLLRVCQIVSSKYTRSKIRKELPHAFAYIIEELLHQGDEQFDQQKRSYYDAIIESIIDTQRADEFIIEISKLIQRLAIDRLHLLGDMFDRGPGAHLIMDTLCHYRHWDMVWGNHDIDWMGAHAGNRACVCNVLRLTLRYGNMATLEDGYGINLLPLATFALDTYKDDPCRQFGMKDLAQVKGTDEKTARLIALMHKAITIIQFKEEGQLIDRHPEYHMQHRKMLHRLNLANNTIRIDQQDYPLLDNVFPTLNPNDPYALTPEEDDLLTKITHSFRTSDKLRRHIQCLLSHGSLYNIANSNLMYHASVPLNADGTLKKVKVDGLEVSGIDLMQKAEQMVREAFNHDVSNERRRNARDYIWYLWCGPDSPLFDKDKMTTFERYFIDAPETHKERKGYYYQLQNDERIIDAILDNFHVEGTHRHIINGHVPVKTIQGESPVKAGGKLLVIDGGFSKAYQPTTGIAGYTLTYHSRALELVQHQPFRSTREAILNGDDIKSSRQIVEMNTQRLLVRDTDRGRAISEQICDLRKLLHAYRHGYLKEVSK